MADNRPPLYQETYTRAHRMLRTRTPRRFLWVGVAMLAPLLALLLGWGFATSDGRTAEVAPTGPPVVAGGRPAPPFQVTPTAIPTGAAGATPEPGVVSPSRTPPRPAAAPPVAATTTRQQLVVTGTAGEGVVLRRTPAGERIDVYREGSHLEQLGPERGMDGVTWHYVRAADGAEGWVAAQYTALVP